MAITIREFIIEKCAGIKCKEHEKIQRMTLTSFWTVSKLNRKLKFIYILKLSIENIVLSKKA